MQKPLGGGQDCEEHSVNGQNKLQRHNGADDAWIHPDRAFLNDWVRSSLGLDASPKLSYQGAPVCEMTDSSGCRKPLLYTLELAAQHADRSWAPKGWTSKGSALEVDPTWAKRSKLAKEFGIKKIHFVPVEDGVLECGTPSSEDVELGEYLGLITSELKASSHVLMDCTLNGCGEQSVRTKRQMRRTISMDSLDQFMKGTMTAIAPIGATYSILWRVQNGVFVVAEEYTTEARKKALRQVRGDDKTFSSESVAIFASRQ